MPSSASAKYRAGVQRARVLRNATLNPGLRPISRNESLTFAHASLAALVAAWEAFVSELARNFYAEISDPVNPAFNAIHAIAQRASDAALERFHTPNWENSRNFLVLSTGYDPIAAWTWPARRMGVQQVQERMNQILQVRHSFAHGFGIPAFSWTMSHSGRVRLTYRALRDTEAFFNNLVRRTESGMKTYVRTAFGRRVSW